MSWYKTGSITLTKNSAQVTGLNTKWLDPLNGVSAGRMLIIPSSGSIAIYEILSVQSNTQLTLATNYTGATIAGSVYSIPTSPSVSIEQFALELSSTLAYYQSQLDGWQKILTGTGDITLTAPDGQKITISSQKELADKIAGAVKKTGDTMTGDLVIKKDKPAFRMTNSSSSTPIDSIFSIDSTAVRWTIAGGQKLAYSLSGDYWHFTSADILINNQPVVKRDDYGVGSTTTTNRVAGDISQLMATGFYIVANDSATGNVPFPNCNLTVHRRNSTTQTAIATTTSNQAKLGSFANDKWTYVEFITTGNSTVDSNGFYKKASPILRLYSEKPEAVEGFTQAEYGLANNEANGVYAKKIGIGHYEIHGSLGFAKEGWYVEQPKDANGNFFAFIEYSTDENNVITIKTSKRKFDLEACKVVGGEPMDIQSDRWIDLRLEMPVIEVAEEIEGNIDSDDAIE